MDEFFKQFESDMDTEFVNSVLEIEKLNKELKFDKVPDGEYKVDIQHMTIKKSKKGNLMLQVGFQILSGQYEKNVVWAYYLLTNLNNVNDFLISLKTDVDIKYENIEQYKQVVEDVFVSVKYWKEYDLKITTGFNGYTNYKILNAYDKEIEELPFS